MNELERTALNEILRTVTYIAEKLDELDARFSQSEEVKAKEKSTVHSSDRTSKIVYTVTVYN